MEFKIDSGKLSLLNRIYKVITETLSITETQFDNLVQSYGAVGRYLENDPVFAPYHPVVSPQGSLRLGTIIQPINKDDDLDVDLVYRIRGKNSFWTQKNIKDLVGNRLKNSSTYNKMMDDEGRRCWTLNYRHESADIKERYHMDILPCVANEDYDRIFREVSGNTFSLSEANRIAIRITDKLKDDYASSTDTQTWLISNPDGYAYWFADRCKTIEQRSIRSIMDSIMPIGRYSKEKSTLQMIVQILKRHRDIKFYNDTENKPISIIITTLAAKAYNGEKDLASALVYVISNMQNYIDQDADGNFVISNPVNPRENFADKWVEKPIRKQCFFEWLSTLKQDMKAIAESTGIRLRENVGKAFGSNIAAVVSNSLAKDLKSNTNSLRVSSTGVLGTIGTKLNATNTFHGTK